MAEQQFTVEQYKEGARKAVADGNNAAAKRLIDKARALEGAQPVTPVTPTGPLPQTAPPAASEPLTNVPPIEVEPVDADSGERSLTNRSLRRAGQDILAAPAVVALPRLAIAGAQYGLGFNDTFEEGLLTEDGELRPVVKMAADLYDWAGSVVDAQDNEDGSIPLDEELGGLALGSLLTLPLLPARAAGLAGKGSATLAGKGARAALKGTAKALELVTPATLVQQGATKGTIAANIAANMAVGTAITEVGRSMMGEQTLTKELFLDEDIETGEAKRDLTLGDAAAVGGGVAAVSLALGRGGSRASRAARNLAGGPASKSTETGALPTETPMDAGRALKGEFADEQQVMVEAVRATQGDKAAENADDLIKSMTGDTIDNQIERMTRIGTLSRDGSVKLSQPLQITLNQIGELDTNTRRTLDLTAEALNEKADRARGLPARLPISNQQLEYRINTGMSDPRIRRILDQANDDFNTAGTFRKKEGLIDEAQRRREFTRGFYMPLVRAADKVDDTAFDRAATQVKGLFSNRRMSAQDRLDIALSPRERRREGGAYNVKPFSEAYPEYMTSVVYSASQNHVRRNIAKLVADQRVMRRGKNIALMRRAGKTTTPAENKAALARAAKDEARYDADMQKYNAEMDQYRVARAAYLEERDGVRRLNQMGGGRIPEPKAPKEPRAPQRPVPKQPKEAAPKPGQMVIREDGQDVIYDVGDARLLTAMQMHPRLSIPAADLMRQFYQQFTTGYMAPYFAPVTASYDMIMAGLGLNARKAVSGPLDAKLKQMGVPDSVREVLAGPVRTVDLPLTLVQGVFQTLHGKRLMMEAQRFAEVAARSGHPIDQQAAAKAAETFMTSMYGTMHRFSRAGGAYSEELNELALAQTKLQRAIGKVDPRNLRFTAYGRTIDSIREGMSMGLFSRNYSEQVVALAKETGQRIDKQLPDETIARIARETRNALSDPSYKPKNQALNAVLSTIPYGNVMVQSVAHLVHHMMTNRAAWSTGTYLIGARMAFTGMMTDEQRQEYEREMPVWKRIMYMPIPYGDGPEDFIYAPLGHEMGTLTAVGADVLQGMIDNDNDLRVMSTGERATAALLDLLGVIAPPILSTPYAAITGQPFRPSTMVREGLLPDQKQLYGVEQQRGIGMDDGFVTDRIAAIVNSSLGTTGRVMLNTTEALTDHPAGALSSEAFDQAMGVAKYEVGRQAAVKAVGSLFGMAVTEPGSRASPLSDKAYEVDRAMKRAAEFVRGIDPSLDSTLDPDVMSNPFQQLPQVIKDEGLRMQAQMVNEYFSSNDHRLVMEEVGSIHQMYQRTRNSQKGSVAEVNATLKELNDRLNERYNELLANYGKFETYMRQSTGIDNWTIDDFVNEAVKDAQQRGN